LEQSQQNGSCTIEVLHGRVHSGHQARNIAGNPGINLIVQMRNEDSPHPRSICGAYGEPDKCIG
jgi:hypothetical protein